MGEFLLSVVIPTRNRSFYAQHVARQVLAMGDSRIQVIVHDNSDEPGFRDQLEGLISSGALTYSYHPGVPSWLLVVERGRSVMQGLVALRWDECWETSRSDDKDHEL
jgi:hypothetical protein